MSTPLPTCSTSPAISCPSVTGGPHRPLSPGVPRAHVEVGAADARAQYPHQDLTRAGPRLGDVAQPQPGAASAFTNAFIRVPSERRVDHTLSRAEVRRAWGGMTRVAPETGARHRPATIRRRAPGGTTTESRPGPRAAIVVSSRAGGGPRAEQLTLAVARPLSQRLRYSTADVAAFDGA